MFISGSEKFIFTKLLQTPIILDGRGVVVQIDESQFRHKPKVNQHCKKLMLSVEKYLHITSLFHYFKHVLVWVITGKNSKI